MTNAQATPAFPLTGPRALFPKMRETAGKTDSRNSYADYIPMRVPFRGTIKTEADRKALQQAMREQLSFMVGWSSAGFGGFIDRIEQNDGWGWAYYDHRSPLGD